MNKLAIVLPCYNEQEVIENSIYELSCLTHEMTKAGITAEDATIVIVDDGSKDDTWAIAERLCGEYKLKGIKLAHNAGHQNALLAGLETVYKDFDATISIDADLQDDINAIPQMVAKADTGIDIVYGVRGDRSSDSFFKRTTAQAFYKFMKLMGVEVIYNHADFRLMTKRAVDGLLQFRERNIFLRGVVTQIGYKTDSVVYQRRPRKAGESKYPLKKMISFAFDGITSFSISPVRFISTLGFLACIIAVIVGVYALVEKFMGQTISGWTSIIGSIWLLGGLQLISIGLIGEYIGKIYKETKYRPRYIIDESF